MSSQLDVDRDDILRLRVLGVHFVESEAVSRVSPVTDQSTDVDYAALTAQLAALGLEHGDVVDVQFFVASRPVALVRCADGVSLLVKWPHRQEAMHSDNEDFWLTTLDNLGAPELLRSTLPSLLGSDPDTGVLVLDGMTDCRSLAEVLSKRSEPSIEQWVRLAAAIATMHSLTIPEHIRSDPDRQSNVPIPTSFHLTPQEYALGCGADFGEYVAVLQGVADELTRLRLEWRYASLIHFDLTGENVLLARPGAQGPQVRLIDWELAGVGDPMYDVGTLLTQLISNTLRSQQSLGSGALDAWTSVGADATRFVATYREVADLSPDDLLRAIRYAGFGQILSALGRLERIGSLGKLGNLALLIGRRVLTEPESVARVLFGASWDR